MQTSRIVRVECYAGHAAHEEPRRFALEDGSIIEIVRIDNRWRTPQEVIFLVLATNDTRYRLEYSHASAQWCAYTLER